MLIYLWESTFCNFTKEIKLFFFKSSAKCKKVFDIINSYWFFINFRHSKIIQVVVQNGKSPKRNNGIKQHQYNLPSFSLRFVPLVADTRWSEAEVYINLYIRSDHSANNLTTWQNKQIFMKFSGHKKKPSKFKHLYWPNLLI